MKKLLLTFAIAFVFCMANVSAQLNEVMEIQVGTQPMAIITDEANQCYHVFCNGQDINWDGIQDEGDETQSWWKIPFLPENFDPGAAIKAEKVRDFDFMRMVFPFRPGYNAEEGIVYLSDISGATKAYNTSNGELINDLNLPTDLSSTDGLNNFIFGTSTTAEGDGILEIIDGVGGLIESYEVNKNPFMTLAFEYNGKIHIVVASYGDYNSDDSAVEIFIEDNVGFTLAAKFEHLGNTLNYLTFFEGKIAAVSNGSHKIDIIDLESLTIEKSINLPTTGYDGPRECVYSKAHELLFVSAYDGNIYSVNPETGEVLTAVEAGCKTEGMAFQSPKYVLGTAIMEKGAYTYMDKIIVYEVKYTSVDDNNYNYSVYPLPAINAITIQFNEDIISADNLVVYTQNGGKVNINNSSINANKLNLELANSISNGLYIVSFTSNGVEYKVPFVVNK